MKRLLFLTGVFFALWLGGTQSAHAACTVSHTFTNGEILTAANLNANPVQFNSCVNNIDNTNIGAAGIFASQLIPITVGQAAFGGSVTYTFPTTVILTGATASTCAGYDANKSFVSGTNCLQSLTGTANRVTVSGCPVCVVTGPQDLGTSSNVTFGTVSFTGGTFNAALTANNNAGAVNPVFAAYKNANDEYGSMLWNDASGFALGFFVPSNTQGFEFITHTSGAIPTVNSGFTIKARITAGGQIQAQSDGATLSYVGPAYTSAGAAVASTQHEIFGTCTLSIGTCTVTFSGAAIFASSSSYLCWTDGNTTPSASGLMPTETYTSGSSVTFSEGTMGGTVRYGCAGT